MRNDQQQADFEITLQYGAIIFNPTFGSNLLGIASQRIMRFLWDIEFTGYVANHFDTRK